MKAKTLSAVAMLAALTTLHGVAQGASPEPLSWMTGKDGCHALLTEKECAEHRATLASLPTVAERYAYLEMRGIPLREREAMCSGKLNTAVMLQYTRRVHLAGR